jgi:23S rRNA (uridine2552-2'-O)-methyltransferase
MAGKNKFNTSWLHQHINDPYVKLAVKHGYRARAAFKLIEIDQQDKLIKPGMIIVDLGCVPGAWSQVLRERLAKTGGGLDGRVIALDMVPMEPVPDVEFLQGDFRELSVVQQLETMLAGKQLDLVISDMAPNLSGVASADAARMTDLLELAVFFSVTHLKPQGALLAKCFHGSGYSQVAELFKRHFIKVVARKPKSSREKSAETYLLGRGVKFSESRRPIKGDLLAE